MRSRGRAVVSGLLAVLAAVVTGLIVLLIDWGGKVEAALLVFGTLVFLEFDAGHPRVLLLLALPIVLIGGAAYGFREPKTP